MQIRHCRRVLNVALSGKDNQGRALSVSMFDAADVVLAVEVDLTEVELSLVSQPYAIKSRMSDESHSARGLQGVPVTAVSDINNGDILVYKDGAWVPTGESDGYTGITGQLERATSVEALSDVSLDGVNDGDILRFDGAKWVNSADQVLSAAQVDEIVGDQGYLKEVSLDALAAGEYNQITGIGGKISVEPVIQLKDTVVIDGSLAVNSIGNGLVPVPEVYAGELQVGSVVFRDRNDRLQVSKGVVIAGRQGEVLSGQGSIGELGVYTGQNELGSASGLRWDNNQGQLGIGELSEMAGVKLNIEGDLRVGNQLIVGEEVLDLSGYVKDSELNAVAKSGLYSDLTGVPDVSAYVDEGELATELNGYYTKEEVGGEIGSRLASYKDGEINALVSERLSDYETASARESAVEAQLSDYAKAADVEASYVKQVDMSTHLGSYVRSDQLNNEILTDYVRAGEVASVARSGSYNDLADVPALVTKGEYVNQNASNMETYATKVEVSTGLDDAKASVRSDVLLEVAGGYVSKESLAEAAYAPQSALDGLSEVARTGLYEDIMDAPDLSVYVSGSDISAGYVSEEELVSTLSAYIKSDDVSEAGKTGSFLDLIDEPDMSEYQLVTGMSDYVTRSDLDTEMMGVLKIGSGTSLDLTGYARETFVTEELARYAEKSGLSEVAVSGQFGDILGTESVVMADELTTVLGDYVTSDGLAEERGLIDAAYYDESELTAELAGLRSELTAARDTALSGYDTKAEVDGKVSGGLTVFESDVMVPAINAAVSDAISEGEMEAALMDYLKTASVNMAIAEGISQYRTNDLDSDVDEAGYIKKDENGDVSLLGNMNVRELNVQEDITVNRLTVTDTVDVEGDISFTGNLLKNGYAYEVEAIKDGTVVEADIAANAVTSGKIADGTIVDGDISASAGIAFSKLAINGANIRSVSPYSGGTGVTVGSDGVIGIGQSVGASDGVTFGGLTVNGNSEFNGNINFTGQLLKNGELYESGAFKKNDAGEAYFDSANVGIGTNDPSAKLEVNGDVKATSFIGDGSQLTGISAGKWSDVSGGISYANNVSIMGDLKMAGTDSYIWTNGSGSGYTGLWDAANGRVAWKYVEGGDLQLVPSAGNVGIGDSSPNHKLDVAGSIGLDGNIHFGDDGTPEISFANHNYGDATYIGGGGNTIIGGGEFASAMKSLVSAGSEDLYLGSDTNVYIFTNSQSIGSRRQVAKFASNGDTDFSGDITNYPSYEHASCSSWTCISTHVFTSWHYYAAANSGTMYVGENNNTVWMRGYATIGDNTAVYPLTVRGGDGSSDTWYLGVWSDGDFVMQYNSTSSYKSYMSHSSGAWNNGSDRRLKKNIEYLTNDVLDRFLQLKPAYYHFNDNSDDSKKSLGLIAQEVQELFPNLVGSKNGYLSLVYTDYAVLSIAAIKELKAEKDAEINAVMQENEALKSKVELLEATLSDVINRLEAVESKQ